MFSNFYSKNMEQLIKQIIDAADFGATIDADKAKKRRCKNRKSSNRNC